MRKITERLKIFLVPAEENRFQPAVLKPKLLFWYGFLILLFKIAIMAILLFFPLTNYFSAISSQQLLFLINGSRQEQKLPPLAFSPELSQAADLKITDMFFNNYFEHTSPTGLTPWHWFRQAGYKFLYAGENLARDFSQADDAFNAWMASPSHRANILNPNFKEIGLAVRDGKIDGRLTTLVVLSFATPPLSQKTEVAKISVPAEKKKTAAAVPKITPVSVPVKIPIPVVQSSPSATPERSSSLTPAASPGKTILLTGPELPAPQLTYKPSLPTAPEIKTPRVLGAFASRMDEINRSLYLYFIIFLTAALAVNVLVKIQIQHWPTIIITSILIVISGALAFI